MCHLQISLQFQLELAPCFVHRRRCIPSDDRRFGQCLRRDFALFFIRDQIRTSHQLNR